MNPRHLQAADEFARNAMKFEPPGLSFDERRERIWEYRQLYLSYVRNGEVPDDYYTAPWRKRLLRWLSARYVGIRFRLRRLRGKRSRKNARRERGLP